MVGQDRAIALVVFRLRDRRLTVILDDGADETVSLLAQRPDEALLAAGIADDLARRADAHVDRGIGNRAAFPDLIPQFVPADDARPMADQVFEQIEDLRLDGT